jgi:hypothetical protein
MPAERDNLGGRDEGLIRTTPPVSGVTLPLALPSLSLSLSLTSPGFAGLLAITGVGEKVLFPENPAKVALSLVIHSRTTRHGSDALPVRQPPCLRHTAAPKLCSDLYRAQSLTCQLANLAGAHDNLGTRTSFRAREGARELPESYPTTSSVKSRKTAIVFFRHRPA